MEISKKSTQAFEAACKQLGLEPVLPDVSKIRPDLGLYLTAHHMLAVIIEAEKGGEQFDITNHEKRKYQPYHIADNGYVAGSSAGGFRFDGCAYDLGNTSVGARLCSNSWDECEANAKNYPDLWEIITLIVK